MTLKDVPHNQFFFGSIHGHPIRLMYKSYKNCIVTVDHMRHCQGDSKYDWTYTNSDNPKFEVTHYKPVVATFEVDNS